MEGWAWWATSDLPVTVECSVNGIAFGQATATEKHALGRWGAPRSGFVGFQLAFNMSTDSAGIVCEVAETGQILGILDLQSDK